VTALSQLPTSPPHTRYAAAHRPQVLLHFIAKQHDSLSLEPATARSRAGACPQRQQFEISALFASAISPPVVSSLSHASCSVAALSLQRDGAGVRRPTTHPSSFCLVLQISSSLLVPSLWRYTAHASRCRCTTPRLRGSSAARRVTYSITCRLTRKRSEWAKLLFAKTKILSSASKRAEDHCHVTPSACVRCSRAVSVMTFATPIALGIAHRPTRSAAGKCDHRAAALCSAHASTNPPSILLRRRALRSAHAR